MFYLSTFADFTHNRVWVRYKQRRRPDSNIKRRHRWREWFCRHVDGHNEPRQQRQFVPRHGNIGIWKRWRNLLDRWVRDKVKFYLLPSTALFFLTPFLFCENTAVPVAT